MPAFPASHLCYTFACGTYTDLGGRTEVRTFNVGNNEQDIYSCDTECRGSGCGNFAQYSAVAEYGEYEERSIINSLQAP